MQSDIPIGQEIQKFLDGVVHDLRAVQRGIGVSAEMLLGVARGQLDQQADRSLRRLLADVTKLNAILAGISSYAMSLPTAIYSFGSFPAEIALQAAMANLEREIIEAGAIVTYGALPEVIADRERLICLFANLIANALKYRGIEAPRIVIEAKQNSDSWIFSVQDNGIGIDEKYWDELFIPFHRLHGSDIPGVGLGLAIGKNIVEAHNGRIWLESVMNKGTTFFFTIPSRTLTLSDGT